MKVLVTGGAGYIGSHTCVQLAAAGVTPIIFDNFSNSSDKVLARLAQIIGAAPPCIRGDIRNSADLKAVFDENTIDAVIHFAGLKAVGESVEKPLEYYDNNVNGSLVLAAAMAEAGVKKLIFSSSATVYGDPQEIPISERAPVGGTTNPYGTSKLMVEQCLADLQKSDPAWSITLLRYFNPVGAHVSGLIGEDPRGIPNNLMPFVSQVAVGRREQLSVFGGDYPTPDGTGVRDFIHVEDLVAGHLAALEHACSRPGLHVYNLGTGRGHSVLEMVAAFEKNSGREVPYKICPRREGDVAVCWADPHKAERELHWRATKNLDEMVSDAWRWQLNNPRGYDA